MVKKFFVVLVGLTFVLSSVGLAFAQAKVEKPAKMEKPAEPAKPAEAAKPEEAKKEEPKKEEAKKEAPPKPVIYRIGGQVAALDAKAGKITLTQSSVKQQKKVTLAVGKKAAKDLGGINVGDVVNVWVTGSTVTSLKKIF